MKKIKLFALAVTCLLFSNINAQAPSVGVTGFNNSSFDQVPFAGPGVAYPNAMTAPNVASSGFNFHIGAVGAYVITQVDHGSGSYDGAITATNVTPPGNPVYYQTFAFTSVTLTKFKLNAVKVKIDNASGSPIPMILAGVVAGESSGATVNFVAMPGSNWVTVSTASNPNFTNINGVIAINLTGTPAITEMAFDDIDISSPVVQPNIPVFTTQPVNKTVCSNGTTTYTATATNAAAYFWLMSTDGLIWNPINSSNAGTTFTGYNTNTLTVTNPSTTLNGLYVGATAVNAVGVNKGSTSARLYVTTAPTVAAITGGNNVCVGSDLQLADATTSGVWSIVGGRATITTGGKVTGTSAGTTQVKYTVAGGACSGISTLNFTVNALPGVPNITYAPGTVNPANASGYCKNKTFTLVGTPSTPGSFTWQGLGVVDGTNIAGGGGSVSASGVVFTGTIAGAASVKYTYTNLNGCSNSRTTSGNIVACSSRGLGGASKESNNNNFTLYPNPSKGVANINIDNAITGSTVTVLNLMGKQIKTQLLTIGNNKIDVSNLSKGIYMVNVNFANGQLKTQKLIIE
jgi:Secretion system C-terminal sorting domain